MSGYPYQQPPNQMPIYPQLYNQVNAPIPGQPGHPSVYPAGQPSQFPGQNPQYPYQPQVGFVGSQTVPSHPAAMSYPGQMIQPTAPLPAPGYYPGVPNVTPQPGYGSPVEWVPTSPRDAHALKDRAVVAGYEGYDGSPLWVIRARHQGDLIPGKLAAKHHAAYVAWGGDENAVQNIEVCCAPSDRVRWCESRDGAVPPNAVLAGNTANGEPLYIGRAREQGSLTPGKVHPSHKAMYISFAGKEIAHKNYEVLCTV